MSKRQELPEPGRWTREELWRFRFPNDEQAVRLLAVVPREPGLLRGRRCGSR